MITKYIRRVLLLCAVCGITACSSNVDYDEDYTSADKIPNTGAPVITAVYDAADVNLTTPLSQGLPGQNLIITGQNLNKLQSLSFNTVEADLTKTYTASTKAYVTIPTAFSQERVNKMEYTTDKGSASFPFVVSFPVLKVEYLINEFSAAGTTVEIIGENFDYYDFDIAGGNASVKIDGKDAEVAYVSAQGLGVKVPAGTPDNTKIVLTWTDFFGIAQKAELDFRPSSNLLFSDLSKAERIRTDQCVTLEDDWNVSSTNSALGTKHLHFSGTINGYAWVELSFSQNLPNISVGDDYNFVFEVLTEEKNPLLGEGYEFAWNWNWADSYLWNPGNGYGLNTKGKWQTVRIPLAEIAPNGIGKVGDEMTLNIGFQPTEEYAADFRLGNFRIQKK